MSTIGPQQYFFIPNQKSNKTLPHQLMFALIWAPPSRTAVYQPWTKAVISFAWEDAPPLHVEPAASQLPITHAENTLGSQAVIPTFSPCNFSRSSKAYFDKMSLKTTNETAAWIRSHNYHHESKFPSVSIVFRCTLLLYQNGKFGAQLFFLLLAQWKPRLPSIILGHSTRSLRHPAVEASWHCPPFPALPHVFAEILPDNLIHPCKSSCHKLKSTVPSESLCVWKIILCLHCLFRVTLNDLLDGAHHLQPHFPKKSKESKVSWKYGLPSKHPPIPKRQKPWSCGIRKLPNAPH